MDTNPIQPQEPLATARNRRILRYVVAGVVLVFLIKFIFYSFEVRNEKRVPRLNTTEQTK